MQPSILVTREVFDETLEFLGQHCEVEANQPDVAFPPETLAQKLAGKDGVVCCLTDRMDAQLIERCQRLKVVANVAVGYNNIDLAACTARGIMATNTPGVLDDSTADLASAMPSASSNSGSWRRPAVSVSSTGQPSIAMTVVTRSLVVPWVGATMLR